MTKRLVQFTASPLGGKLETMCTLKGYVIYSVTWRVSEVKKDRLQSQKLLHWNGGSSFFLSVQSHLSEMLQEAKIIQPRVSNHQMKSWGSNSGKYLEKNGQFGWKCQLLRLSGSSLSVIVSLWLNHFFLQFPIPWSFERFIKQFTEGFQNIQEMYLVLEFLSTFPLKSVSLLALPRGQGRVSGWKATLLT